MAILFSCPADSSICDLVTDSLTHWVSETPFEKQTTEWPPRLVTFEAFNQSDKETRPDQKKRNDKDKDRDNDKDKYTKRAPSKSNPRDLWPLRHLIRVMRRHDLTKKKTMTKANTFRDHLQRAMLETCDFRDIWSEWRGNMTLPRKRQQQRQRQRQWQRQWQRHRQIHFGNSFKEPF